MNFLIMKVSSLSRLASTIFMLGLLNGCVPQQQEKQVTQKQVDTNQEYTVAAYIWPSCHHDSIYGDMLWPDGIGEWEVIKKGTPRYEGHYQPRHHCGGMKWMMTPR